MADNEKIMVFHYRHADFDGEGLEGLGQHGYGLVTRGELKQWLNKNPGYQTTIKRVLSNKVEVLQQDLLTEEQKAAAPTQVNFDQHRASIGIPLTQLALRGYRGLTIISKTYPASTNGTNDGEAS